MDPGLQRLLRKILHPKIDAFVDRVRKHSGDARRANPPKER
jgi:hypothetical protein